MTEPVSELQARPKVAARDVAVNRRRGGDIRIILGPKTVGSTSGFLGTLALEPGEYVAEHYHPYSEEFLYVVHGRLIILIEGVQETELEPGDGFLVPIGLRHRLRNSGREKAQAVFHLSPLAPRPELGHVDTEPPPDDRIDEPMPDVGNPR
jgi:putative monooxygenase